MERLSHAKSLPSHDHVWPWQHMHQLQSQCVADMLHFIRAVRYTDLTRASVVNKYTILKINDCQINNKMRSNCYINTN